jgi:1-acyl-sn-glycerol-3-phosphate acyltransferase
VISKVARTFYFYFVTGLALLLATPFVFIIACLPEGYRYDSRLLYWWEAFIYRAMVHGLWMPVRFKGCKKVQKDPLIVAANHQSALDIPLLGHCLGLRPHIWFFKSELTKLFFFGFIARRLGIPVDRSSPRRAVHSLTEGIRLAGEGRSKRSLIIFPEGGRYIDGQVHDFLAGFAILAKKTGLPLMPVYIQDAYKAYPPGSFWVEYSPIEITVGEQFAMNENETNEQFVARVYQWFLDRVHTK